MPTPTQQRRGPSGGRSRGSKRLAGRGGVVVVVVVVVAAVVAAVVVSFVKKLMLQEL